MELHEIKDDTNVKVWLVIGIVFSILLSSAYYSDLSITGLFIAEEGLIVHEENLSFLVNEDSEFSLEIEKPAGNFDLRTLMLSGDYIGNGSVNIYLETDSGTFLILDDKAIKNKDLAAITAYAVHNGNNGNNNGNNGNNNWE